MTDTEYDVTLCRLMSKHQNIVYKTNLKYRWEKNTRKWREVNFYILRCSISILCNLLYDPRSILFHDQFTDSLLHCLHPVLVNCEISLDLMMSETSQCYRRMAKSGDGTIFSGIWSKHLHYGKLFIVVIDLLAWTLNVFYCNGYYSGGANILCVICFVF